MLLTFSVTNFKCFKNKVTFSFEADEALDELYIFNEDSRRTYHGVEYNTVNALYGANASGKSTLLEAMQLVFLLLSESSGAVEGLFRNLYFSFNDKSQPIEFEITYLTEAGERIRYDLEIVAFEPRNTAIIQLESLTLLKETSNVFEIPMKLPFEKIFERTLTSVNHKSYKYDWTWGISLKRLKSLLSNNKGNIELQQPYALLLSNPFVSELDKYRRPLQLTENIITNKYITFQLLEPILTPDARQWAIDELAYMLQNEDYNNQILKFLNHADLSITSIFVKDEAIIFKHKNGKLLNFEQQSDGTKKYLVLVHIFLVFSKFQESQTAVPFVTFYIDELEKSLHYKLASAIIDLFQHKETNPHGHRLVFTTHDTRFLQPRFLHGDQVWFISRDNDTDETLLESPVEYKDFDPFHLDKGYLSGGYSGIPNTQFYDNPLEI